MSEINKFNMWNIELKQLCNEEPILEQFSLLFNNFWKKEIINCTYLLDKEISINSTKNNLNNVI